MTVCAAAWCRRFGLLQTVLVLAALCPPPAAAQVCTSGGGGGGGGNKITLTPSPSYIEFTSPGAPEFQTGHTDYPNTVSVDVQPKNSNKSWNLCIRASDPSLGGGKPVTDLLWSLDGASWTAMMTTDELVISGTGAQTVTLQFRMQLSWVSDSPGTYSAPLTLTAVHP